MRRHRIVYSDDARATLHSMHPYKQSSFYTAVEKLLRNPYGLGSTARSEANHREAVVDGNSVVYRVVDKSVEVTVVRISVDHHIDNVDIESDL